MPTETQPLRKTISVQTPEPHSSFERLRAIATPEGRQAARRRASELYQNTSEWVNNHSSAVMRYSILAGALVAVGFASYYFLRKNREETQEAEARESEAGFKTRFASS